MSLFGLQKSFENSLRSSKSYQVPLTSSSKTEVHKGCTGKAHACGSIKSANAPLSINASTAPKLKGKSNGESLRKNSLSSETVSDSGSEISSSWNSNKDTSSILRTDLSQSNPLKRTKSVNYSSSKGSLGERRKTSDSGIIKGGSNFVQNGGRISVSRLLSDTGNENIIDDTSKLQRTSSFRSKNTPPKIPLKSKATQPLPPATINRNGSFNNRLRNSFRNKNQVTTWNALWEFSFASKSGGGSLMVINQKLLDKSKKITNVSVFFLIDDTKIPSDHNNFVCCLFMIDKMRKIDSCLFELSNVLDC